MKGIEVGQRSERMGLVVAEHGLVVAEHGVGGESEVQEFRSVLGAWRIYSISKHLFFHLKKMVFALVYTVMEINPQRSDLCTITDHFLNRNRRVLSRHQH